MNDVIDAIDGEVVCLLASAPPVQCWVVGGAVRRAFRTEGPLKDVDLVVDNPDFELALAWLLERYGVFAPNRYGNPRFTFNTAATLDLWSPSRFFEGYSDVLSMFDRFDFTCNCVGISKDFQIISRFAALSDIRKGLLRPVAGAWTATSPKDVARLVGRAINMILFKGYVPERTPIFLRALDDMAEDELTAEFGYTRVFAEEVLSRWRR